MNLQWLALGSLLLASACGGSAAEDKSAAAVAAPAADKVTIGAGFIMGADASMLSVLERLGGRFSSATGEPGDPLAILQDNGIGWIRLRLWHTPVNSRDVIDGDRIVSRHGDPVGGGNNDLATTVRLAKRAKAQGMKVLLDIHYSDFWADPGHQEKPAAWATLHGSALEDAVGAYTRQVLSTLAAANATPDMVQLGNETNGGFLWPDGKTWVEKHGETIGGNAGYVALLKRAIAAVRASDNTRGARLPVMVHLANGGDNALYRGVFDMLTANAVDFDVIGLSYYPYHHGPLAGLRSNLHDLAARYGKPLVVVETAYAYTLVNGDDSPNVVNAELAQTAGYPASVQGQADLVRDVIETVASVPQGLGRGVFYWEPLWIPVAGAGWRTGDGNGWDNQAMFDFGGRALPSLQVFKRLRELCATGCTPRVPASATTLRAKTQ